MKHFKGTFISVYVPACQKPADKWGDRPVPKRVFYSQLWLAGVATALADFSVWYLGCCSPEFTPHLQLHGYTLRLCLFRALY